jgi:hypothetical protein
MADTPSLRSRVLKRVLRPLVTPFIAREAADLEAETAGLRTQVHALEDKVVLLVTELERLTDRLTATAED